MSQATRQTRTYRRYRIVAQQFGESWTAVVHAPGDNAIVDTVDGASDREAMIKGMAVVDDRLKAGAAER